MTMRRFPAGARNAALCERARSWAALAPDGELSELERKLLHSHLERCSACASFAVEVEAIAVELRAAALQPLPQPVALPVWRRRPVYARMRTVGAAAAVAVMALGIASRAPLATEDRDAFQFPRIVDYSGGDQAEAQKLREIRIATLAAEREARTRPARHFGNQPA
jgi:anti-sigma factor RsiW